MWACGLGLVFGGPRSEADKEFWVIGFSSRIKFFCDSGGLLRLLWRGNSRYLWEKYTMPKAI